MVEDLAGGLAAVRASSFPCFEACLVWWLHGWLRLTVRLTTAADLASTESAMYGVFEAAFADMKWGASCLRTAARVSEGSDLHGTALGIAE